MIDSTLKNASILIVDDQQANIDVLTGLLDAKGFTNYTTITDSRQVFKLFAEFKPDLLLLDLKMPHLTGFQVMKQLKVLISPETFIPILVLTVDTTLESKQKALAGGASDFLAKPFDLIEVDLRIKNLLKARSLYQQLENQNQILEEKMKDRTKELHFQNEEKEKRATELIIANKELVFQNEEKEKRAAKLIIANKELAFQNEEKEKRAAELIIANKELAFQNKEKEKRAAELIIANKELAFQHEEKGKRAAELIIANKELEAFSYSVSHDLNAPLRHINGYAELLLSHFYDDLPDKARHYLDNIADSASQMATLIDDLLQFSRTGRQDMRLADLDMNIIVQEVLAPIKQDNRERNIEWRIATLPHVYGDQAMLRLVWTNLLSNAVKFTRTREKTIIEINVSDENDAFIFSIRDNGVGFDMQYAQKLFGVFQRLHTTDEFEGTGIGLTNVHRIILRHGGRTWAEAEPDKGATFYFSLLKKKED